MVPDGAGPDAWSEKDLRRSGIARTTAAIRFILVFSSSSGAVMASGLSSILTSRIIILFFAGGVSIFKNSATIEAMKLKIPAEIKTIAKELAKNEHEAYLVGGCVRDLIMGREPKDWDITTDANPEKIQKIFPDSVYENSFGTVGVKTRSEDARLKIVEITTFRLEGKYSDKRHPDEITFANTVEEDLSRRDFTMNAIALALTRSGEMKMDAKGQVLIAKDTLVDPYDGQEDIKFGIIRTVGNAEDRFNEDALRMMRAVRLAADLGFEIDVNTRRATEKLAGNLEAIAHERIRDEFSKMIMCPGASRGIFLMEELDLLRYVLPELREGIGVDQNLHHIYTVFEHSVRALDYAVKQGYSFEVRLAALLHDIGKPRTKGGEGHNATFYNHEMLSARMTVRAMDRLRFSKDFTEKVAHLVRWHMFYYNVGEVSPAGVRRFLVRVGPENIDDMIKVREADRIGSGTPKAVPYKLRHLLFMIEKVKRDPLSPKMLKLNGDNLMALLNIQPGPRVGQILTILLEDVLDNPKHNTKAHLSVEAKKLNLLSDAELIRLMRKAKDKANQVEKGIEEEIKKKHHVK